MKNTRSSQLGLFLISLFMSFISTAASSDESLGDSLSKYLTRGNEVRTQEVLGQLAAAGAKHTEAHIQVQSINSIIEQLGLHLPPIIVRIKAVLEPQRKKVEEDPFVLLKRYLQLPGVDTCGLIDEFRSAQARAAAKAALHFDPTTAELDLTQLEEAQLRELQNCANLKLQFHNVTGIDISGLQLANFDFLKLFPNIARIRAQGGFCPELVQSLVFLPQLTTIALSAQKDRNNEKHDALCLLGGQFKALENVDYFDTDQRLVLRACSTIREGFAKKIRLKKDAPDVLAHAFWDSKTPTILKLYPLDDYLLTPRFPNKKLEIVVSILQDIFKKLCWLDLAKIKISLPSLGFKKFDFLLKEAFPGLSFHYYHNTNFPQNAPSEGVTVTRDTVKGATFNELTVRTLNLAGCIIERGATILLSGRFRMLESLNLHGCLDITDGDVGNFSYYCYRLSDVDVGGCHLLTDDALIYLVTKGEPDYNAFVTRTLTPPKSRKNMTLTALNLSGLKRLNKGLKLIENLPALTSLDVSETKVDESLLELMPAGLKTLKLSSPLGEVYFREESTKHLTNLTTLDLSHNDRVQMTCLFRLLTTMPQLRSLSLEKCDPWVEADQPPLPDQTFPNLEVLNLGDSRLPEKVAQWIVSSCPHLRDLEFYCFSLELLQKIPTQLTCLKRLYTPMKAIPDELCVDILASGIELDLECRNVSPAVIRALDDRMSTPPPLTKVYIGSGYEITDLEILFKPENTLRSVIFQTKNPSINERSILYSLIRSCSLHLEKLDFICLPYEFSEPAFYRLTDRELCLNLKVLHAGVALSNAAIQFLAEHSPFLRVLTILSCKDLTDDTLRVFSNHCLELETLSLQGCPNISEEGLKLLHGSSFNLKSLSLGGSQITDASLRVASLISRHLRDVNVASCPNVTDKGILFLIEKCQHLRKLSVDFNKISLSTRKKVKKKCKFLEKLVESDVQESSNHQS